MRSRPSAYFDEDFLPPGQEVIETIGVIAVRGFINSALTRKTDTGYATIRAIVGPAGIGKSIAVQAAMDRLATRPHTALPLGLKLKVQDGSTAQAFARDIVLVMGKKPEGKNRYETSDQAARIAYDSDLCLLAVDEADRLDDHCFEVLRYIHDKAGTSILLVGLEHVLDIIMRHEKFDSRSGAVLYFPQCTEEDILTKVLPRIVIPRWSYDAGSEKDLALGQKLYELAGASFRILREILCEASVVAKGRGQPKITSKTIDEAIRNMALAAAAALPDDEERGSYELDSERRHLARRRRKPR